MRPAGLNRRLFAWPAHPWAVRGGSNSYGRLVSLLLATLGPEIRSSNNVRQLCLNLYDEVRNRTGLELLGWASC